MAISFHSADGTLRQPCLRASPQLSRPTSSTPIQNTISLVTMSAATASPACPPRSPTTGTNGIIPQNTKDPAISSAPILAAIPAP